MCLLTVCLLWRNVCLGLLLMFWVSCLFFILNCKSWLYILEINPLSVASFTNKLSYSKGCLFILFTVYFTLQKLLNYTWSCLFIFVFIFITLGGRSKRILFWLNFNENQVINYFIDHGFGVVLGKLSLLLCFVLGLL